MAFIGMVFAGAFFLILAVIGFIGLVMLIIGIVVRKKTKIGSNILLVLGSIGIILPIGVTVYLFAPKTQVFETEIGTVRIRPGWISQYDEYLKENNTDKLQSLLDKHPEMIYYYDINRTTLLIYGHEHLNVEIMQIAIDHGAKFDDPYIYDHKIYENSFDSFFDAHWGKDGLPSAGVTTDEVIDTVRFMIDNGASLKFTTKPEGTSQNFYERAEHWIMIDGVMSEKDMELLTLIENNL